MYVRSALVIKKKIIIINQVLSSLARGALPNTGYFPPSHATIGLEWEPNLAAARPHSQGMLRVVTPAAFLFLSS